MESFTLELDDRTKEEREKDREIRKHHQTMGQAPMDSDHQDDLGTTPSRIRIGKNFAE